MSVSVKLHENCREAHEYVYRRHPYIGYDRMPDETVGIPVGLFSAQRKSGVFAAAFQI